MKNLGVELAQCDCVTGRRSVRETKDLGQKWRNRCSTEYIGLFFFFFCL